MTNTIEREPTEEEREQDIKFLTGILMQIRGYAFAHDQEPDDTLRAVANWILGLLEVATFNGGSEDKDERT